MQTLHQLLDPHHSKRPACKETATTSTSRPAATISCPTDSLPDSSDNNQSLPSMFRERGYFEYAVKPSQNVVMSTFGSPTRTTLDHSYSDGCDKTISTSTPTAKGRLVFSKDCILSDMEQLSDNESPVNIADSDYVVSSDSEDEVPFEPSDNYNEPKLKFQSSKLNQKKFIIFEHNLEDLMNFCKQCGAPVVDKKKTLQTLQCKCLQLYLWQYKSIDSQLLTFIIQYSGIVIFTNIFQIICYAKEEPYLMGLCKQ